jgi:predicted RNA polymerase sigma factor
LSVPQLAEHFFRHEYGRIVAMLSRRVGLRHIEAVEDAAQSALLRALESWTKGSVPENPSAWLFRAAQNQLVGELRRRARGERLARQHDAGATEEILAPCALHTLNRAVAVAQWRGPAEGLAIVEGLEPPSWLAGSYLWAAVLADLHRRCGHDEVARRYREMALQSAPSAAVRDVLKRRLQARRG